MKDLLHVDASTSRSASLRGAVICALVVVAHVGVVWGLHAYGGRPRVAPEIVPVQIMSAQIAMAAAPAVLSAKATPTPAAPPKRSMRRTGAKPQSIAPSVTQVPSDTAAVAETRTLAVAEEGRATAGPSSAAPVGAASQAVREGEGAFAVTVPPSSNAAYLANTPPDYPVMSRRLREQGKVLVRVLIGADGSPVDAQIKHSSGFGRLDHTAVDTAMRWRYVPGRRNGVAEAMWFDIPFHFSLT